MSCLRLMPRLVGRIARREKTSSLRLLGILSLLIAAAAAVGWSQAVNATLLGTVTDATGAVVPNAKLTVTETQTGIIYASKSNESGNWVVPNLPPGAYEVDVEAAGFKKELRKDIALLVNTSTRVDIQLQPGNVTETIEVIGAVADGPRRYRPQHGHHGCIGTAGSGQQPQLSSSVAVGARHLAT